jgi:hypothetical protein
MKIKSQVVVCGKAFLFSTLPALAGLIRWLWKSFPRTGMKFPSEVFGIVLTKAERWKGAIYHARKPMDRYLDKILDNLRGLP